ncbi:15426_t:CDS:2, partial [Acaulospora morrowiae]
KLQRHTVADGGGMLWLEANVATASDIIETVASCTVASIQNVVQCCAAAYNTVASCTVASCLAARYAAVYHVVAFNLTCCTVASHVAASLHRVCGAFYPVAFKSSGALVAISHCGVILTGHMWGQLRAVAMSRQCGSDFISCDIRHFKWQLHFAATSR